MKFDLKELKDWSVNYLKENKKYIIIVSIFYLLMFLLFFIFFLNVPISPNTAEYEVKVLDGISSWSILMDRASFLWLSNKIINMLLLFFGILILGLCFSVGIIAYIYYDVFNFGLGLARIIQYDYTDSLITLLTHQILLLPIVILVGALSLKLTVWVYKSFVKKPFGELMKNMLYLIIFYFGLTIFIVIGSLLPVIVFELSFLLLFCYGIYFLFKKILDIPELKNIFKFFFLIIVPMCIFSYLAEAIIFKIIF